MKNVIALILLTLASSCNYKPKFGDGSTASYGNNDMTTTSVITQNDTKGDLLFVIAWTARHGAGSTTTSGDNLFISIHGHPINPSVKKMAIYALQKDHQLKEIPLSSDQIKELCVELGKQDFHTSHCKLWEKKISPHLVEIEAE